MLVHACVDYLESAVNSEAGLKRARTVKSQSTVLVLLVCLQGVLAEDVIAKPEFAVGASIEG